MFHLINLKKVIPMPTDERNLELRRTFKLQLIQNPNYFGNLSELKIEGIPDPVEQKIGDTTFEELTCLGYNPETEILTAIVEIKQGSGYLGDACTDGSREYVRFYLDYGDGSWVDHGSASFNMHDLGFSDDLCYAVSVKIDPKKTNCCDRDPVLPRVRAILAWNVEPPADTPDYHPVWGNRLDRAIQIEPRSPIFCWFIDQFEAPGVSKIDPVLLKKVKDQLTLVEPPVKPAAAVAELVEKADQTDELASLRAVFPMVAKLAAGNTDIAAFQALKVLEPLEIDISKFDDFILHPKFNTTYEELHCVGLDREKDLLHGVIEIKRSSGYSGDLCSKGSREYIAFYLDFGSGWEYQGTTWVEVHDIDDVPEDGLWYQASLPVDLDDERKQWCETGRARIRGILSWSTPPAPFQPEFVPHWGDREECWIEIKPLPEGIPPGVVTPFIESIGSVPVNQIDGAGFANGASIGGTFTADDSPFGGVIRIAGQIAFPTSNNLEYRVMVKGPSDATFKPWTKSFKVTVATVIGGSLSISTVTQTASGDWFEYIPQKAPVFKSVAGNLLAPFTASEEGLHRVYIQIREAGSPILLAASGIEAFFVDDTRPAVEVEITSGAGNCGKFGVGEVISGTYSMSDLHSRSLTLSVTPSAEASGGHLAITSVVPAAPFPAPTPGPSATSGLSYAAQTLTTSGASGTWELDTNGMDSCGYNIRIHGEDRTIVNSGAIGWEDSDIEGFCLE